MRRKARTKTAATKQKEEDQPIFVRAPRPASLSRLLAIYHRLARQPHLVGPPLFEHIASLRDGGLLRFSGDRCCLEQEPKVLCRAQLPLVRLCAGELGVD